MSTISAQTFGKAVSVSLLPSDNGLDMVFWKENGERVRISLDWPQVADMALRVDTLGQQALTMMQVGMDPYSAAHRSSFFVAELQALDDSSEQGSK